jgi:hypothetical protein
MKEIVSKLEREEIMLALNPERELVYRKRK